MPKPMAILPIDFAFLRRPIIISSIPATSAIGAREEGWKIRSQEAPPEESRSSNRMIWPVTVVPTFAPMMMPSD